MKTKETNIFYFLCVASIFKWLSDWWNQFFLATMQTLKSGACGGPFQKSHRKYLFEQPAAFLFAKNIKQNYIEKISVKIKIKSNTKSGPCLEISCATIFQPRIPAHLIWCTLHIACTLFPGTDLKYNPPPYWRKLTSPQLSQIALQHKFLVGRLRHTQIIIWMLINNDKIDNHI